MIMHITLNGADYTLPDKTTINGLVQKLELQGKMDLIWLSFCLARDTK